MSSESIQTLEKQFGITFRDGFQLNDSQDATTQLLHGDLRRMVAKGGVERLLKIEKDQISNQLFVQVEEFHDVSMSLRDAAKQTASGIDRKATKRCLNLILTDGLNSISAVEMQRNESLNDLVPGSKLFLNNFEVRLGTILIQNDTTIRILGGQCLELIELNALSWKNEMLQVVGKPYFMNVKPPETKIESPQHPQQSNQREQSKRHRVTSTKQLSLAELFQTKSTSATIPDTLVTRAILVEIVGSFTYHTGEYVLSVLIDDGTLRVVCKIEDSVVQNLIKLPAPELLSIRHNDDTKFQQIASNFRDVLEQLGPKLFKLKNLNGTPIICAINNISDGDLNLMEENISFLMSKLTRSTNSNAAKLIQMLAERGLS